MFWKRATLARVGAGLGMALLLSAGGMMSRQTGWLPGDAFTRWSYDTLHSFAGPREDVFRDCPVALIYLDLHSCLALGVDPLKPWPRELHARLTERLASSGARAVVFDIVFGGPGGDAAADEALAGAIRENGRVILAGQANANASQARDPDRPWARLMRVEPPFPAFATNAAGWGAANLIVDEDFVPRRYFAGFATQPETSLSWAAARRLELPLTKESNAAARANQGWIRYYGPALGMPHVSYAEALRRESVPDEFFRDKVVWVGSRPMVELLPEQRDQFRSPFHSWRYKELFMPGVEAHATALLNLMRGDGLRRVSAAGESAVLLMTALVLGMGFMWLSPMAAAGASVLAAGLSYGMAAAAFERGVWFPWLIVAGAQAPGALFGSWLFHFWDWRATRRRLEAARRIAEEKIRQQAALIDKATDAIFVQDLAGAVVYANPSAVSLYGWTLAELTGGAAGGLVEDADKLGEARAAVLARGEWKGEVRQRNRAGARLTVESRWTLIRDEAGRPRSLLIINSDVTEKRQLESETHRLQRTEAIGMLASGIAHDLNNALAPVLMGTQLLEREACDAESRRILGLMRTSAQRGADMVRQVLLFARGKHGEREAMDLRDLVREMEKLARETFPKNIRVASDAAEDLWLVCGNPTELHQALLNLCVNARDAMPGGGALHLALDNVTLAAGDVHKFLGAAPGEFVSLLVSDSGDGIPPGLLPRIFEPFFSTKPEGKGTGLGLSTTARILKSHGGFISVDSAPGEGTVFEIFLPRFQAAPPREAEELMEPGPRGRGERILVVDDDRAVRELIRAGLEEAGYRVFDASNGVEGLGIFKARQAEFALVICDVNMPVMDGVKMSAAMKELRPRLPCLFMTGAEGPPRGSQLDEPAGFYRCLAKPFLLPALLRAVREGLETGTQAEG